MAQTLRRLAGLTFAAVLAGPALAQSPTELGWCANDAAATPALQIKDCTRVIQSGKTSPATLILALTIRGRAYDVVGDQASALNLERQHRGGELEAIMQVGSVVAHQVGRAPAVIVRGFALRGSGSGRQLT